MSHPYRGIHHEAVNAYLRRNRSRYDWTILCGKPDDERYTTAELESGAYVGLKMYPHYVEPPYERLDEFFPAWAMRAASNADVPIILHVRRPPSTGWQEILSLAERHPQARIVLAHLGRETQPSMAADRGFAAIAECPRIAMDVSMATNPDVMQLALTTFGAERILFGSDEPFNLLRYVDLRGDDGERVLAPSVPYHWIARTEFERLSRHAVNAPLLHWQVLGGLVGACDALAGSPSTSANWLHRIFALNAIEWFGLPSDLFA